MAGRGHLFIGVVSKYRRILLDVGGVFLSALAVITLSSCNHAQPVEIAPFVPPVPPFDWPTASPQSQGLDSNLVLLATQELQSAPYVESFVLVRHGFLVAERYFTLSGKYTSASLASVTKSFTSALVGIALREHCLDSLGQKAIEFFPEYVTPALDPRKHSITLEHLLTMRAGFDDTETADHSTIFNQSTNWIQTIIDMPLRSAPGEAFNYTSVNAHLMSGVLTKATQMSTIDFAQRFLFAPLKITVLSWPKDPQNYNIGGSGIVFYPRDLARFGYLYVRNGVVDSQSVIPAEWVSTSTRPHDTLSGSWGAFTNVNYGYFWWTSTWNSDSVFLAIGFGGQFVIGVPGRDLVIVVTSNLDCTQAQADQRQLDILDILSRDVMPAVRN